MRAKPKCAECSKRAVRLGRCEEHARIRQRQRDAQRPSRRERGYDDQWYRDVEEAINQQPWCSECGSTEDLTGDHETPLSRGGSKRQKPRVLCRICNSRKGNRT